MEKSRYDYAAQTDAKYKAWEEKYGVKVPRCRICAGRTDEAALKRICPWCGAEQEDICQNP